MPFSTSSAAVLFSFFCCLSVRLTASAVSTSNTTDVLALFAFKAAIVSDPLNALTSWNDTVFFCTWKGVTCGHKHGDRVVSINLMSQGLMGSLSPYIGNLSFLRSITLQNNSFHGELPQEIGRLSRLRYVEFSNNSFSGQIPENLSQCVNLYYLNLIDNNLTGTIIPELSQLVKLRALGLSLNRLSGTIPPWIGNLTYLNHLSLGHCGLAGQIPESLAQLQNLRVLILSESSFTGNIPSQLFNSSIFLLLLGFNRLQGTIPSDIGPMLPNIRRLELNNNMLSGEILVSLRNASFLELINLAQNNFTGSMSDFQSHRNLKQVSLVSNNFMGDVSFVSSLTNSTNLKNFAVSNNLLNGSLPSSIGNLSKMLVWFSVGANHIHGRVPPSIGDLGNLRDLTLGRNYFSGPIPSSIGKLVNLQWLVLDVNGFTGNIPPSLGNLTWLNGLRLASNNISGSIPLTFSNYKNLLVLDLSYNSLNGLIPQEVLSISSISIILNMSHNRFIGPIPQEVGLLKNLGSLDLSHNRLSGLIPNALSNCISLEQLHLQGNSFEGEVPVALSTLRGLEDLDLSRNQLSGQIPSFLGELRLMNLNLSFNKFQGEVPTSGVFQNKSAFSVVGNIALCGGIDELGLLSCPTSNHSKKKELSNVLKIVVLTGAIVVILSIFVLVFYCVFMYKRKTREKNCPSMPSFNGHFRRLSYSDLLKATNGFSESNLIGAGRFGSVYNGMLDDGKTTVAVKVLNLHVRGASRTFMAECNALRGIRHKNLVKILSVYLGMDFRGHDFKALVYEFKSNGSLEEWLHCKANEPRDQDRNLTMIQRLNIAIDVAAALEYLHFGTEWTIIHGDLKPSNILLDDAMTAHVGDFGLAKVLLSISKDSPRNESSSFAVKGTIGYVAPEYGMGDTVSTRGDAYSFGVLLLEMFTSIRPTNIEAFRIHSDLRSFVSNALPDSMTDILDPFIAQEIEGSVESKARECMLSILSIGVACSNEIPRDRMMMADVVTELNKIKTAYLPN